MINQNLYSTKKPVQKGGDRNDEKGSKIQRRQLKEEGYFLVNIDGVRKRTIFLKV